MRKLHLFIGLISLIFLVDTAQASHLRAGDIAAKRQGNTNTFNFVLTLYRDTNGVPITDAQLDFGDNTVSQGTNLTTEFIGNETEKFTAEFTHTYSGGVREAIVSYSGDNRNAGIINIGSSQNVSFYIETKINFDLGVGINSSPVLLYPPIDEAVIGQIFTHNPAAYDPDGDSLSYELIPCRSAANTEAFGYRFPDVASTGQNQAGTGPATFTINSQTGDLIWNVPRSPEGLYNAAIKVTEWRRNFRGVVLPVGYVVRDMQIRTTNSRNRTPVINLPQDTCIVAGSTLTKIITATDPDSTDRVILTSFSGLYELEPATRQATFTTFPRVQIPPASGVFSWSSTCQDIQKEPYSVVFRAVDTLNFPPALTDISTWRITVLGPPPQIDTAIIQNGGIVVSWLPYNCLSADSMIVYRRIGSDTSDIGVCAEGELEDLGYQRIGFTMLSDTSFRDENIVPGPTYCYRLRPVFALNVGRGGRAFPSQEVCVETEINVPVILNVSVQETAIDTGKVFIKWSTPLDFVDTLLWPGGGPFVRGYTLFRTVAGQLPVEVYSNSQLYGNTDSVNLDTTYTDTLLNTEENIYTYNVHFTYGVPLSTITDSSSAPASSVRLEALPLTGAINLNWSAEVPWSNSNQQHYIYQEQDTGFLFIDSVLVESEPFSYVDAGTTSRPIEEGVLYCYYVTTAGTYSSSKLPNSLLNNSQVACATTADTMRPCSPVFSSNINLNNFDCTSCDDLQQVNRFVNTLNWQSDTSSFCDSINDIASYNIYYTPYRGEADSLIAQTSDTFFVHQAELPIGCYRVATVDLSGNESSLSQQVCTDICPNYVLPNIITPNSDEYNETFRPLCTYQPFVKEVRFKVYNRWGKPVYESSDDILIQWPGTTDAGLLLPAATYFYEVEITTTRLSRDDEKAYQRGWVQIIR